MNVTHYCHNDQLEHILILSFSLAFFPNLSGRGSRLSGGVAARVSQAGWGGVGVFLIPQPLRPKMAPWVFSM